MKLFPNGIIITQTEYTGLLHVEADPEQWLKDALAEKARLRRDALINEWRPRLFADSSVAEFPADADALARLILSRRDCKSRAQADAECTPPELPYRHNLDRFNARTCTGAKVTLFQTGIDLPDLDYDCILVYVQDLDDWVLGALLGQINRGKKKMIREWQPKLFADPNVSNIPANEDQLIQVIVNLPDYKNRAEL